MNQPKLDSQMKNHTVTVPLHVRLDPELKRRLALAAERERRTISQQVRRLIEQEMERLDERHESAETEQPCVSPPSS